MRDGFTTAAVQAFDYNREVLGTTVEESERRAQFTVPVVVQRNRIERTRAKFDTWSVTFLLEAEDELVDQPQLITWLGIAGRRVGMGDWRPEKSGDYGRFVMHDITRVESP